MKVKVLFAALAGLVLASCTNNEQLLDETKKGREIRFAVASQTQQTRAEHDKAGAYTGKLLVWAWREKSAEAIINGDTYDASSNTFNENKLYYYPVDGSKVDFLLVPLELKTNGYFNIPTRNVDGTTDYTFTVGHGNDHDGDQHKVNLMTSEIVTQDKDVVPIVLRHLTSKIKVRIQQTQRQNDAVVSSVILNKVLLKNIKNTGFVTLDEKWTAENGGNDVFWKEVDPNEMCNWTILDGNHTLATTDIPGSVTPYETDGKFYILPQELANQQFYIEYTVVSKYNNGQPNVTEQFHATINLTEIGDNVKLAMNKYITYIISVNPVEDSHKITFDVEEEAWGELNGEATITPGSSSNK